MPFLNFQTDGHPDRLDSPLWHAFQRYNINRYGHFMHITTRSVFCGQDDELDIDTDTVPQFHCSVSYALTSSLFLLIDLRKSTDTKCYCYIL